MNERAAPAARLLVVEDDANILELLAGSLRFAGFDVVTATNGTAAVEAALRHRPDLIVLDVMLPDLDGFAVVRRLRSGGARTPVLFLTARDAVQDRITGLTIGGDDYVTKPFSVEALIARVRALLRRVKRDPNSAQSSDGVLRVADLELDEKTWTVRRGGVPIDLSPTEFRLLAYMMHNAGRVLTRAQLLENVWGWDYAGQSQIVETYVSYLRRKLDPFGPNLIHTQRGVGYALRVKEDDK